MEYTSKEKESIYLEYHKKVLGYIRTKLGNDAIAEDLCSDVFLKIYEKLDQFDDTKSSISTWIFTITRNTLTDYYRTRRVYDEIPETQADDTSIEDDICNAETLETLATALSSLDERERDIIVARFYQGKTLSEIAQNMGISYAYVKVLQNKAFSTLKTFFEN